MVKGTGVSHAYVKSMIWHIDEEIIVSSVDLYLALARLPQEYKEV